MRNFTFDPYFFTSTKLVLPFLNWTFRRAQSILSNQTSKYGFKNANIDPFVDLNNILHHYH